MKYTQEQIEAQKLGTHLVLSANAGSGKTKVLTERYLKILYESPENDINQIVAITFTEKAANEMLERIVKQIDEDLENAKSDNEKNKFRKIRSKLSYAKIMTIHSFCLQILRDYTIEVELQPNFKTLSQIESYLIQKDAISAALTQFLSENTNENQQNLPTVPTVEKENTKKILFTKYKISEIKGLVELLLKKSDIFNEIAEIYENQDKYFEKIWNSVKNIIPDFVKILKFSLNSLDEKTINSLWKSAENGENKQLAENLQIKIFDEFQKIKNEFEKPQKNFEKFKTVTKNLLELCKIKADKRLFYVQKLLKKANEENCFNLNFNQQIEELDSKEYRTKIENLLEIIGIDFQLQFDLTKQVIEITKLTKKEIFLQKQKLNGIDFDDMLNLTRNLLTKNPKIAQTIASEFSNIMVDEFQDTNSLQYEIVKSLVPSINFQLQNFPENQLKNSPKLFIVGDEKQSIYRFRNADVEIFQQAKQEIKAANEQFFRENLQKIGIENSGIIKLTATFRMQPAITTFVNKVCGNLFSEIFHKLHNAKIHSNEEKFYSSENYTNSAKDELKKHEKNKKYDKIQFEYSDLVCARNGKFYSDQIQPNCILSKDFGSVKFLITVQEKENSEVEINESDESKNQGKNEEIPAVEEAKLIAKYINSIVKSDKKNCLIQKGIGGEIRYEKPEYADIAILFRSRTQLNNLIFELSKNEIPFDLPKGSGFFDEQEIVDLTLFLRFLNDPQDDFALLGTLFSPFFGLNNLEILNLHSEEGINFWTKLQAYCEKNYANEKMKFAFAELSQHLEIAKVISIPHLIRTILKSGSWIGNLLNNPRENQILNNVEKFISIAREFQNRGFLSLNDFVNELELLAEISQDNESAKTSNKNAVTLQTIHSAKGLEFPVVILYNTNSPQKSQKLPIIDKNFGLVFTVPKDKNSNEKIENLACILAKSNENNLENAENLRLLYVAMTRAKDHLIISANLKTKKNGFENRNSFFRKIANTLDLTDNIFNDLTQSEEKKIDIVINSELKLLNEQTVSKNVLLNIEIINDIGENTDRKVTVSEKNLTVENTEKNIFILSENPKFSEKNRFFSFSELNSQKKIKNNDKLAKINYVKKILGFENFALDLGNFSSFGDWNPAISGGLAGSEKGKIFHNILQKINDWFYATVSENFEIDEKKLIEILTVELNLAGNVLMLDDFLKKCKILISTKLIQKYKNHLKNAIFEHKFHLPINENFYTGIIDCLICDEAGNCEIWDWKTNKITDKIELSKLKNDYELQMKMYIYFLMHFYPKQDKYTAKLLFTELSEENAADEKWITEFIFTQKDKEMIYSEIDEIMRANCYSLA